MACCCALLSVGEVPNEIAQLAESLVQLHLSLIVIMGNVHIHHLEILECEVIIVEVGSVDLTVLPDFIDL
jgi:hypothetical protein